MTEAINYEKCDNIITRILALEWLQPLKIAVEKLIKMQRVQVRETDDPEHILKIKDLIEEEGSTVNTDPIVVFDFKSILKHIRKIWDGNHTTQATDACDPQKVKDKSLRWQLIPKHITDSLNEDELSYIGNALNPIKKRIDKENGINDCVKLVLSLMRKGHEKNSDEVNTLIKKLGHIGGAITSIKTRAWNKYGKELSVKPGHVWKQYKTVYKKELKKVKKELSTKTNEVLDMSSAYFKEETLTALATPWSKRMDKDKKQIKNEIVVVVQHPDILTQNEWDSTQRDKRIAKATYVLHKMNGIKLKVYELHPWASDGTSSKCSCCPKKIYKDISHKLT